MIALVGGGPHVVIRRWVAQLVVECQCEAKSLLILHDAPVACPACGLVHQFASFDYHGDPVVPAELGVRVVSFQPRLATGAPSAS